MITINDTIAVGKSWLLARLDDGQHCPLCGQMAKMYKRKINSTMARAAINLYRIHGRNFGHGPSLPGDSHEISQLVWWGLIEEESVIRTDGGRAGHWRITDKGEQFVLGRIQVATYAKVYDGKVRGFEGPLVSISQSLGKRFNYSDLMAGI